MALSYFSVTCLGAWPHPTVLVGPHGDKEATVSQPGCPQSDGHSRAGPSGLGPYLLLAHGLQLLGLALPVVLHDHHGCIDLPHRQVRGWGHRVSSLWVGAPVCTSPAVPGPPLSLPLHPGGTEPEARPGLALTLVRGDQQVQRLLGQVGPDGHYFLPQLSVHLLFVGSACGWAQRGISRSLGQPQSQWLLSTQALGSWFPVGCQCPTGLTQRSLVLSSARAFERPRGGQSSFLRGRPDSHLPAA